MNVKEKKLFFTDIVKNQGSGVMRADLHVGINQPFLQAGYTRSRCRTYNTAKRQLRQK
jgi:hypothetical protein